MEAVTTKTLMAVAASLGFVVAVSAAADPSPTAAPITHLVCNGTIRTDAGGIAYTFELAVDSANKSVLRNGRPVIKPAFTDSEISYMSPGQGLGRAYAAIVTLGASEHWFRIVIDRKTGVFHSATASGLCVPTVAAPTNLF